MEKGNVRFHAALFPTFPKEHDMHKENGQIVETPVEARAGFLGRPVLIILILSTAAVIAGFIAVYTGHFGLG